MSHPTLPPGWADEPRAAPTAEAPPPPPPPPPLLGPRLLAPETEGAIAHRAPPPQEEAVPEPGLPGSAVALTAGLGLLLLGWLGLGSLDFVRGLFARAEWLGWLGAGLIGGGWLLAAGACWAEWRALRRLGRVRALAGHLARLPDAAPPPAALIDWLEGLAARLPEAGPAAAAMARAPDMGSLRGLWRGALRPVLEEAVARLGREAGRRAFLGTAIAPSPALDGLVVLLIGLRLLRQVARLHGMRPGALAGLALLRRLIVSAGVTTGVELAAETAFAQAMEAKAAGLAGGAAGAVTAALRMPRLAAAAGRACRPLE